MLWMRIIQGRDLPAADMNGFSDPYVEVKLSGHHRTIYKTQVVKRNLNPVWGDEFTYQPSSPSEVLKLNCWDHDTFTRDDFLGYCTVPLGMYANRGLVDEWLPLMDKRGRRVRGDIHIQVKYQMDQPYAAPPAAMSPAQRVPASNSGVYVAQPLAEDQIMREDPVFAARRRMRMMQNPEEFTRPDLPGTQTGLMGPGASTEMPSLRETFGMTGLSRMSGFSGRSGYSGGSGYSGSSGQRLVANPNYDPYPDFQPHPLSGLQQREITPEDYDLLCSLDEGNSRTSSTSSSLSSSPTSYSSTSPATGTSITRVSGPSPAQTSPSYAPSGSANSSSSSYPSASSSSSAYSTYSRTQNPMTYSSTPVQSTSATSSSPPASANVSSSSYSASASSAPAATNQCKICYDNNVDCVLIPCGHAGMCFDCANIQKRTNGGCPFCRVHIDNIVKQFPV